MKKSDDKEVLSLLAQAFTTFSKSADKLSAIYAQLNRENIIGFNNAINVPPELLYSALECVSDGITIIDKDGTILYMNCVALSLEKLDPSFALGKTYREIYNDNHIYQAIETGKATYYKKWIADNYQAEAFAKPIIDNSQNIIGAIEVIMSSAKSISYNQQTEDFPDYLSKLIEIISDIIVNIVHRMRSPLNAIQLFAELLKDDIDNDKKSMVQDIIASVYSIEAILSNLSSSVKAIMPHVKNLDIISILEESVNIALPAIRQQSIKLIRRYADNQMYCLGDEEQLKQVYFNIILNAIQAMPDGGELIIVTSYSSDLKYIEIEISDNGCGIPDKLIDRLFMPFFTTKEGGTGLGLYVAYRIMQAHKGKIKVNSVSNKGTTVLTKIPIDMNKIA